MPQRNRPRICALCEASCGLLVDIDDEDKVIDVRGDPKDPLSRGFLCAKGKAMQRVYGDRDRLITPVARRGDRWEQISWEQALDEVAARIAVIQREHGDDAMATYMGNPTVFDYATVFYSRFLLTTLHSQNRYSAASLDGLPHMVASYLMFGHQLLLPVPDVDRTCLLVMFGANPAVSNGSIMTAPGFARRVSELHQRGGKLVVVDPRRTETARLADQHLFIAPGTDPVLLLALLRLILRDPGRRPSRHLREADIRRLEGIADGVDEHTAASVTGISADATRALARDLVDAAAAACYARIGVAHQPFSTFTCWLVNVLNLVTGNLDRPGGSMFGRPAVDLVSLGTFTGMRGRFGPPTRVRGLPSFTGERPTATLADEISTPGPGRVRGLVTVGGNLAVSAPNGRRLAEQLKNLDLFVAVDPYLNSTTRHAHYVLPPASTLTRDQYSVVSSLVAVRNVAKYTPALTTPQQGAREEWRILHDLQRRVAARQRGLRGAWNRAVGATVERLGPGRILNVALLAGPYGLRHFPRPVLTLGKLRGAPHGVDLGPLVPMLRQRLARLRVVPPPMAEEARRVRRELIECAVDPNREGAAPTLRLIGRRQRLGINSWLHHSVAPLNGADGCVLLMHPDDARDRQIADGSVALVQSRAGSLSVPVTVTEDIARGVVCLPHGWASTSLNDVTDHLLVDAVSGTAAFTAVSVVVSSAP